MTRDAQLPRFDELPVVEGAPKNSAWGVWGPDDQLGSLNLLNDDRTKKAAADCVQRGAVFNLNLPLDQPWRPPGARRGNPEHFILYVGYEHRNWEPGGEDDLTCGSIGRDDYIAPLWLQGSSQWDGIAHIRHPVHGNYNGVPDSDIHGDEGAKLGVDNWAKRAVVGRGVVVDVHRYCAQAGRPIDVRSNHRITAVDLRETVEWQGVEIEPGDVMLLHTGWMANYQRADEDYRRHIYTPAGMRVPGLDSSDEMLEYLWNLQLGGIAADNTSLEYYPAEDPADDWRLHLTLLPLWGMAVGESWVLEELADDCARDGRYTCLLVSVPLNVRGGLGSPSNAVAIK